MFAQTNHRFLNFHILKKLDWQMLTRPQFASIRENLEIKHDAKNGLFYADINSKKAFLQYEQLGNVMILQETEVPQELEGKGLGKILAKEVFDYVAENGLKMKLECTFLQHYAQKYGKEYDKYITK